MSLPDLTWVTDLPTLPPRACTSHKGDFGRVLLVVGSRGMSGAACLAGHATLRGGAGLVTLAVPAEIQLAVSLYQPCYMTVPLPSDADGRIARTALPTLLELAQSKDVLALGPGLGRSTELVEVVRELVVHTSCPLVLDADGLNNLRPELALLPQRLGPTVLTPHPGEFGRLVGLSTQEVQASRLEHSVRFAAKYRVVLVLKGHETLVTDGHRVYQNTTGNPGLATGGSGDVLTGLIAALLGQGLPAFEASQLGVYLHGLAGDIARNEVGEVSLLASDVVQSLPSAFGLHAQAGQLLG